MQVKSKIWLESDGKLCFGTGRARLLRAVERTGSLSRAAQELGVSYRHAWSQVRSSEERLGELLLVRRRGGKERGGAELTGKARELIAQFEELDSQVRAFIDGRVAPGS